MDQEAFQAKIKAMVERDRAQGFVVTDPDDGWQRCKQISEDTFHFRACYLVPVERDVVTVDEFVCLSEIDQEDAVLGYYGSVQEVMEQCGAAADQIIAECYFEKEFCADVKCAAQLPADHGAQ